MKNREIKFRVRNTKTNEWVHGPGYEVNLFGEMILLGGFMNGVGLKGLDDCVPLQFTGLKDKNGKEIYEGDIVLIPDNNPPEYGNSILIVEYHTPCWCYREVGKSKIESIDGFIGISEVDDCAEIIGNIFQNPELTVTDKELKDVLLKHCEHSHNQLKAEGLI